MTIAKSGERKSTCDALATRAIREIERERQSRYLGALAERNRKARKNHGIGVSDVIEALDTSEANVVEKLIDPSIFVADWTYEGLLAHFDIADPSVAIVNDEAGQFFGGFSMRRENKLKTISGLSKLWDGSALDRRRVGSDPAVYFGRRASIHFMVQPAIAVDVFADQVLVDQGLLSRFLVAWPVSNIGYRTIENAEDRKSELNRAKIALKRFEERLRALAELPLPRSEHTRRSSPHERCRCQLVPAIF